MPYSTVADLKKKLPETVLISLSNDVSGATSINADIAAEAIDTADKEIDSYIGLVYTLPLATIPSLIADLSAKMAIWNLHLRKYFDSKPWRETYDDCRKILLRIAEGKLSLQPDEPVAADSAVVSTRRRQFTRHTWRDFNGLLR